MIIRAGFEAAFEFAKPTAVVLMGYVHPSRTSTIRRLESLRVMPKADICEYFDLHGNLCGRTVVTAGYVSFRTDALIEDDGQPDFQVPQALQHSVQELPNDVLLFLLASRYCEVDSELRDTAWSLFGHLPAGWSLVQAVCDYVHNHIRFDYLQARANRTALEAYREQVGVCRDYMHLAITFCRCLNIPARYCTGYLGDLGVPSQPSPMDFSAWFEVYLGGQWHAFDARNNTPRIGRILMARGRDAADVALTTTFGENQIRSFQVWSYEVPAATLPQIIVETPEAENR
ncbi:transglutaminase-like domain-containing protein [Bythopirellula polymerisocia]|uniref:Transglutaminase-like superfamily protein n=1 Tax=Bythopirellula polymerisocia TaxID=2528003 RepID=A0A5C6CZY2_9BACT|nr:transglutaminase family protein [Bythopirellula polymerisocia]TWU30160.1 Transglutaminase-like superfamily protein [Bythopirellula polymerisocia]